MAHARVASRYIKSLLGLAVEQGVLDQVHADLQLFDKVCKENRSFRLMLNNPIIKHGKKRDILEQLFKAKVHPLTMAIMDIITRKNREPLLPEIASGFHIAYKEYNGVGSATITTAIPMDDALRNEIQQIVKELTERKEVEVEERVDSDMIGGFVLKVGDKQVDASIKSKLKALRVRFSQNPYIKEF